MIHEFIVSPDMLELVPKQIVKGINGLDIPLCGYQRDDYALVHGGHEKVVHDEQAKERLADPPGRVPAAGVQALAEDIPKDPDRSLHERVVWHDDRCGHGHGDGRRHKEGVGEAVEDAGEHVPHGVSVRLSAVYSDAAVYQGRAEVDKLECEERYRNKRDSISSETCGGGHGYKMVWYGHDVLG